MSRQYIERGCAVAEIWTSTVGFWKARLVRVPKAQSAILI